MEEAALFEAPGVNPDDTEPRSVKASTPTLAPRSAPVGQLGLWVFVGLTLLGLAGSSLAVLAGVGRGADPPFLNHPLRAPRPTAAAPKPRTKILRLAGSGTNLPLMRKLAAAFRVLRPKTQVIVHESIGSGGGVQATRDGIIDLGLISRSLEPDERTLGLTVLPYARVAVVIAANPVVDDDGVDRRALLAIYRGERTKWRDGSRIGVVQRERGDSSHLAVSRSLPGFAEVNAEALARQRWRVVYRDSAMREALQATPGAVGLFDLGAIVTQRLSLKVLSYEGVRPSARDPLPARYPFFKDLAFVSVGRPTGLAAAFLAFVFSEAGAAVIRRHGYQPTQGSAP